MRKMKFRLYGILILINFILLFCTYKIMPIIQNYPPNSENIDFQRFAGQFSHIGQYIIIFLVGTMVQIFILNKLLKRVSKFLIKYDNNIKFSYEEIKNVRKDCINIPYKFYIMQMVTVLLLGMVITLLLISEGLAIFKFFLMIFAITSLIEIIQLILIQKELKKVLKMTYEKEKRYERNIGLRLNFSNNLILQIIPFISVSIIVISLIGYAKATEEYANANANYYEAYLLNKTLNELSIDEIIKELNNIPLKNENDYFFILNSSFEELYISNHEEEVSNFFKKYMEFYFKNDDGIGYEFYGTEKQAYTMKLKDNGNEIVYISFEYSTENIKLMLYYGWIILGALFVYTIFLYFFAKNISNNILSVSDSLRDILHKKKLNERNKLPILSNDEIGDLSYYYNKIEELTEENEKELKDNEYVMQRQAQFAILGEFAGGIAHDLNSPLLSVQLDVETLKKYINSEKVTANSDIKETLLEMLSNIDSSLGKMGKTILGIRNQIRSTGDSQKANFSVKEVVDGIEILFGSILRKNNCQIINNIEKDYELLGEKNKLDRVLGNIIKNSIDAYQEKSIAGIIEVNLEEKNNIYILSIKDSAGGISKDIQKTLFKEMKTTKSEKGTGFGLYYSNTIIESSFKGKMYFKTEQGVGTTFYIEIPIIKEDK